MKKIILVFLFIFNSLLGQNFDKKWDAVVALEKEGKIKSADAIVDGIYQKAASKNNEPEIIKTFFYKSKYLQTLEEDAQSKIIANLKTEIDNASTPAKAILNLIYAKCLNEYYNNNRYRRTTNTKTNTQVSSFLTWSNSTLEKQIELAFNKSIANETSLKKINLNDYKILFDFTPSQENKNNSLFNFLLKENIAFYKSKINTYQFDSEKFENYTKELLGSANEFTKLNLDFIENIELEKLLSYYQKLEQDNPTFENQFERIQFCNDYLVKSDEDLLKTYNLLQKKTKDTIQIQKIQLEKASIYIKNASKETHPDYNIKGIKLLDSILSIKNRSNAYKQAYQKKHQLNLKNITVQLEKYIYPNQNTRALIRYKNASKLSISYFKINNSILTKYQISQDKKDSIAYKIINNTKPLVTKNYDLPNNKDYFEYTTELLLPQMETGSYFVYFESDSEIKDNKGFAQELITVSNLSVLVNANDDTEFYTVVNRKTGQPIANATLKSKDFNLTTGADGVAVFKRKLLNNRHDYSPIEITTDTDTIQTNKNFVRLTNEFDKNATSIVRSKVEFFLDRAIYRPGQTVYYKGIAFQKKDTESNVVPNAILKINIKDASNKIIKEFEATTNEFGSFSGEFIIPTTGLTGSFMIEAINSKQDLFWKDTRFEYSRLGFKVEEYKRPKFEIKVDPITKTYAVNQEIDVTGKASSFSGAAIADAKVSYTITRETFMQYYGGQYVNRNYKSQIITQAETKTDAKGNFAIDFIAKPDPEAKIKELPIFGYRVKTSVTDLNGETRSIEQLITNVGYHALKLKAVLPKTVETKDKNTIKLESTNLNDIFEPAEGELKFYCVQKTDTKFKPRVWNKPEIETISESEFERLFPYEQNQKPTTSNTLGELVYSTKVNTAKNKEFSLDFMQNYPSGKYKVVYSATDKYNNLIENVSDFQLKQSSVTTKPNELFTVEQLNTNPKKDGFVKVKIRTIVPEIYIKVQTYYKNWVINNPAVSLKNNERIITFPIPKEFENELKITFTSIFENTIFKQDLNVILEKEEPKLNFEITSFRNKLEPGKSENWSFKLSSSKTKLESEVLASMYDQSLDQFTKEGWSNLSFHENSYYRSNEFTTLGFQKIYSNMNHLNTFLNFISLENENQGAKLMWFGFNFNDKNNIYTLREYQKQLAKMSPKPPVSKMVYGVVSKKNGPISGVTISIKGTDKATISEFDGYYQIEANKGDILTFSYLGFKNKEQKITEKEMHIILEESGDLLEEVVVVGYQKVERSKLLGSVKTQEDNTIYNTAGIEMALAGKTVGMDISIRGTNSTNSNPPLYVVDGDIMSPENVKTLNPTSILDISILKDKNIQASYGKQGENGVIFITTKKGLAALSQVKTRTNLSETAFFFPHLKTDSKGNLSFNFTSPEALTAWKLRLLAHNKDAVSGYMEQNVITQKELMVVPNFPRFFREKDSITITTKINNMTKDPKTGLAVLQLFDATTMQAVDRKMMNIKTTQNFTIDAMGNTTVSWKIFIPEGLQGVQYKVVAKAGNYSDGEENAIPVLTNSMLVTESRPIWVRDNSTKEYTFENLKNNTSTSLRNHQFTFEYTSNPTWLAIQSLPYLMEYEHECAEQTFARFYANALATTIINSNPKIATVFESWRKNGKLNSKLEENEELKSILLAETPWVNDAKSEDEKKQHLATLFDLEKMKSSQETIFSKLQQKQKPSGGFPWFDGSDENEYITRHILAGLGHLSKLSTDEITGNRVATIAKNGIPFIDSKFMTLFKSRTKNLKENEKLIWYNPYSDLHYLYTRSFYLKKHTLSAEHQKATQSLLEVVKKDWLTYSLYEKGMAALALNRFGDKETAKKIITSLKETASNNEDWGMYWIENKSGWYWYQVPIETQALLIEAFDEVANDTKSIDAMKVWLLKNKQTKNWPTTKATTEAVYALLLQGNDWLSVKDNTIITIGNEKIISKKLATNEKEAETGYLKINWKADEIKKDMATIAIENKSKVPGYGGVYWQYFEDLDNIKSNSNASLSVSKELYLKKATDKGDKLQKISATNTLKIGDLVTVRLIISTKEDMEFVHLKDMRASCFEPIDVLSGYEYKSGLGFYKSTKDVATHFFFDKINKGTYVLEYDIRVNNKGDFSNGITTIQSMYAPEFSSHTKGIRVNVKE
ncbi:MG2 domain-containing protein [Flavobacterium faecale]|uniref:alpha-2-macroglobulin family protein n=1 Tax=Flavobacterium faecale TaxID=1355330 RepID=UPI003AB0C690